MHITLRHLRIFEAVARHGSISRAAGELHLTQPAVSMQMKQLEEQIGLPLLTWKTWLDEHDEAWPEAGQG
jgi:LysR family transcriptional regulator, low CO2-responsive transcriptional regulator